MLRRPTLPPPDDDPVTGPTSGIRDVPDLSSLAIAGLTRRRLAGILGTVLAIWIVVVFARQVGEASAATARAEQMAVDNVTLSGDVAAYERELELIQRQRFVEQQARAYGIGSRKEIAFTLSADAPPLPDDAPGSASVRLGAETARITPWERWLTLLFGPSG
jgi:hypothetical protein